jgi:hypothetical protein
MLRPIAENTFADCQIAEFQFAEILFVEMVKFRKCAEILFAAKSIIGISYFLGNSMSNVEQLKLKDNAGILIFPI